MYCHWISSNEMAENGSKKKDRYWKNKLYNYYWRIAKSFIPFVFDSGCGNLGSRLATVTNVTLTEAKLDVLNKTSVEIHLVETV